MQWYWCSRLLFLYWNVVDKLWNTGTVMRFQMQFRFFPLVSSVSLLQCYLFHSALLTFSLILFQTVFNKLFVVMKILGPITTKARLKLTRLIWKVAIALIPIFRIFSTYVTKCCKHCSRKLETESFRIVILSIDMIFDEKQKSTYTITKRK